MGDDRPTTRYLLACGLAPVLFTVVILLDGATRPGYAPLHHFASELSLGERGWIQITNFIATGLLTLGFAAGLRRALPSGRGSAAAPLLTAVFGLCLIVAGVFSTDPLYGYPAGSNASRHTVHGLIHDANAVPCFAALAALQFVLASRFAREPGGRLWMWYCVATGVLVVVTFAVTGQLAAAAQQTGTLAISMHGLWQRVTIVAGFGWFGVLAVRLLRHAARAGRRSLAPAA